MSVNFLQSHCPTSLQRKNELDNAVYFCLQMLRQKPLIKYLTLEIVNLTLYILASWLCIPAPPPPPPPHRAWVKLKYNSSPGGKYPLLLWEHELSLTHCSTHAIELLWEWAAGTKKSKLAYFTTWPWFSMSEFQGRKYHRHYIVKLLHLIVANLINS